MLPPLPLLLPGGSGAPLVPFVGLGSRALIGSVVRAQLPGTHNLIVKSNTLTFFFLFKKGNGFTLI